MKLIFLIAGLIGIVGCATSDKKRDLVVQRAPFDLNCDASLIEITSLGRDTYGVSGCSRRASYIVQCVPHDAITINACKAVMNSDLKSE